MLPRGVVLELPVPRPNTLPGDEARYAYMSTFNWFPLVNGYSGFYPPSYLVRLDRLRGFPGETSLRQIRADGVKYLIVHQRAYFEMNLSDIRARLATVGMEEVATLPAGPDVATLYRGR